MADHSADEFLSATKSVLERFHIDKFREITAGCHFEFVKRKRCFGFTVNGLRKIRNFSVLLDHRRCCVDTGCSLVNLLMQNRARVLTSIGVQAVFIGDERNDESVTRKKELRAVYFHVVLGT